MNSEFNDVQLLFLLEESLRYLSIYAHEHLLSNEDYANAVALAEADALASLAWKEGYTYQVYKRKYGPKR